MRKPADFDNIQAFGEFTPLELGGHILVIKQVKEIKDENGNTTRVDIAFDTHTTDKQPDFYKDQYRRDTRPKKNWNGVKSEWPYTRVGATNPFFKKFIDSVKASNKNFELGWEERFEPCFKGMLVGGVFGREQYLKDGQLKVIIKCVEFRSVEAIKAGVKVPADKMIDGSSNGTDDLIPVHDDGDSPF